MTTARITHAVIAERFSARGAIAATSATCGPGQAEQSGDERRQSTLMAGIDAQFHTHADTQRRLAGRVVDAHAQRNALNDLDPVAAAVLGGEQRKARGRRRADALDRAGPLLSRIGVDLDGRFLPGPDI